MLSMKSPVVQKLSVRAREERLLSILRQLAAAVKPQPPGRLGTSRPAPPMTPVDIQFNLRILRKMERGTVEP